VLRLTQEHIHALYASKLKNTWLFNFGDDILISTLITTVESNLRISQSWNTICIMEHFVDWSRLSSTCFEQLYPSWSPTNEHRYWKYNQ